jgi:hypothetical protein
MPHILKTIPPSQSLIESYKGKAYKNAKGNTECVEFIQQAMGAPNTGRWTEGDKLIKGDKSIAKGTAIATFVGGKYPDRGKTGKHAAVYLGQDTSGVQVLDQWNSQGMVLPRTLWWDERRRKKGLQNDPNAFSVIEW